MSDPAYFRVCSTCRTPIAFEARYYACSVSTCNRKGTALYFCSVPCWDAHVPDARHRDAWAEEERAPTLAAFLAERAPVVASDTAKAARRVIVSSRDGAASSAASAPDASDDDATLPQDVLVVVSKLKAYVKARSGMNTSDGVTDVLSAHLRSLCTAAVRSAAHNSRKTVLARDFEAALRGGVAAD
jgi:histone H3/H4